MVPAISKVAAPTVPATRFVISTPDLSSESRDTGHPGEPGLPLNLVGFSDTAVNLSPAVHEQLPHVTPQMHNRLGSAMIFPAVKVAL
ncbi:hypothetical protein MDOR_05850 [Mycolicibacterium doricum]|uniref:Uncharacterized protein n=1 Tax=Mycolicibacterium doricum TaxID=126673 RepID=A0A7I7VM86_9MYCO|nr:hypothetical protein MDOR_05850 [Mycolicibacterium doricum]